MTEVEFQPDIDTFPGRWSALWVLASGVAMIVIDGTIVSVALPVIIGDLGLDLSDAQWVSAVYAVVFAALLLTSGRLGDRFGRRKMFVLGVIVFMVGSLLAAVSSSATALILARMVQGVGGSLVLPGTLATVNTLFQGKDRAAAFGIWGAVIAGMAAIGPLLGGWLTTSFTWPWIFLVNIPVGILVVVAALMQVPETRGDVEGARLDIGGLVLSTLGFGSLVFGLIEGTSLGWWTPISEFSVLGLTWSTERAVSVAPIFILVGAAALAGFVWWEHFRARFGRSTILDLSLFSTSTFSWGNFTVMLVAIGEFGLLFILPLFIVNALGLSTLRAGVLLAAMATGAFISGSQARHLADRMGSARVVTLGLALEIVGILGLATLIRLTDSQLAIAVPLMVYGVGLGLAAAQLTSTTLEDIPLAASGQASATQSTMRQLGAALGAAMLGTVLSIGLVHSVQITSADAQTSAGLVTATRQSAGSVISELRSQGTTSQLGADGPSVVNELSDGFSQATTLSLFVAAGFLVLALGSSIRLVVVDDRSKPIRRDTPARASTGVSPTTRR